MIENGDAWQIEASREWLELSPVSLGPQRVVGGIAARLWTRHTGTVVQRFLVISGGRVRMYPEQADALWQEVTDALPFNARWIRLDADDDGADRLDELWDKATSLSWAASILTASFAVT